jgi:acetyl-CoA carboxylase biotin carboxyl carrier protein
MTSADEERQTALRLAAELLERLRDDALRELEVREGGVRVRVSKNGPVEVAPAPPAAEPTPSTPSPSADAGARPATAAAKAVVAPLTGIFYRSTSPQVPPFVQVGSVIAAGDVVGLIEAMKLFNEVRSTLAGRVARIVAENGQLVRAHHPLLELE